MRGAQRRRYERVAGPFDGCLVVIEIPLRIADLSEGGCFVLSQHDPPLPGTTLTLRIELPAEGWITVKAEALYAKPQFGYAVRFVELPAHDFVRLQRMLNVARLADQSEMET